MPAAKLPPSQRRSHPKFVNLRPGEAAHLAKLAHKHRRSASEVLREAYVAWMEGRQPFWLTKPTKDR